MKLKKGLLTFVVAAGVVSVPVTALAAHTHSWGAASYYGIETELPSPADWDECITVHSYNVHQCLVCGVKEIFKVSSVKYKHNFQNGICTNGCGRGYARDAE